METRKRKPLSDLTNTYNLIPTSALRKLVASSSNSGSFSKPPNSILKSANQKICSDSSNRSNSRSDTSIGSSNVSAARNSRTVQFRTPTRANPSITYPEGGLGRKDAAYNRRQSIEKSNKAREAATVIVSPTPLEKRKDKGIAVPFSSPPPEKIMNENEIFNSFGCSIGKSEEIKKGIASSSCSLEKTKDGNTGILKPSGSSVTKTKEIRKEFLNPSSFLVERAKEKGMGLNILSSLHEKTREKGKAVLHPSDIVEITKHEGSSTAVTVNCPRSRTKSEKRKNAGAASCPPITRTKNIQNDLDEAEDIKSSKSWTDPHPKCRKKKSSRMKSTSELPLDFIEQQKAYFKEVDEFELPEEEISQDELD
ncbi:hypothetical protein BUALT_Bualt01G0054300 [Buddleja alternifolia]|uniref:Sororin C-terminal region domain-containing protein n=1 Tax=Buddleja alternifolia TaxID=168488 RepID=A0AAV6YCI8_9LAMI|nr:hypothetical protein BUALT_Bualt01G0054300 [Buddleja alternifolia]